MEKYLLNKNNSFTRSIFCCLISILVVTSCNPTKYVLNDESLLSRNNVVVNNNGLEKSDIEPYIKQKPNKRIFGARFHLALYNLSNLDKETRFHNWLREIGEEPVIYDEFSTVESTRQIDAYIASKGYFDSSVKDSIETVSKETKVYYTVDLKAPYTLRNIDYSFEDSTIFGVFQFDSVNCLLERGGAYDEDLLKDERTRFSRTVKNLGFYSFSEEYISFKIDSTVGNRQVDITYEVGNFSKLDTTNRLVKVPHSQYQVRNIYVYPDFVLKDYIENSAKYQGSLDTIYYNGVYFISPAKRRPEVKYDLILRSLSIKPGMLYNVTNTEQTETHLLALKVFRLVNIFYNEADQKNLEEDGTPELDCVVQLSMNNQQSYKIDIEGTNTAGDLGGALGLTYQHNNLFRGAEQFNMTLKGAYEVVTQQGAIKNTQEYGIETSLKWPKFIMPYPDKDNIVQKYNPSTSFSGAYNFQNMPLYSRTMGNASFGYNWTSKPYSSYIVNPLQFNVINVLRIDSTFKSRIDKSPYLASAYTDVVILGGSYSYVFTNQSILKSDDYWFLRVNFEPSGNILGALGGALGLKKVGDRYYIFDQPFAQYVKADFDLRYHMKFNDAGSMAYRLFMGGGVPYGNSQSMPFEKQYFGGGANGIRAWQVRTLGPGSYLSNESGFLNQTGDIKIEANAEYRFKLFWVMEGAVFVDAGNIWSFNYDKAREGSQFKVKSFYKDIAVGSGMGLRFDLNFVLIRTDMGIKLRDPAILSGSKWIVANRPYNFKDDLTFVIAIGYPF